MNKRIIGKVITVLVAILCLQIGSSCSKELKEYELYLSDIKCSYQTVGYGNLSIDKDASGKVLSLISEDGEVEFEHGYFAHAYSTIVFDGLQDKNITKFETYFGVGKSARNNENTDMEFIIYFDSNKVYHSNVIDKNSMLEFVELSIPKGTNRITLVIDDLGKNGNDHGVWANPKISYLGKQSFTLREKANLEVSK